MFWVQPQKIGSERFIDQSVEIKTINAADFGWVWWKNLQNKKCLPWIDKSREKKICHPTSLTADFRVSQNLAEISDRLGQNEYLSNRVELSTKKYIFGHPKYSY